MYMSCAKKNGNKAETFSGHLSGIFAPHDIPITQDELKITDYFPNTPPDASSKIKHFTIAEIARETE